MLKYQMTMRQMCLTQYPHSCFAHRCEGMQHMRAWGRHSVYSLVSAASFSGGPSMLYQAACLQRQACFSGRRSDSLVRDAAQPLANKAPPQWCGEPRGCDGSWGSCTEAWRARPACWQPVGPQGRSARAPKRCTCRRAPCPCLRGPRAAQQEAGHDAGRLMATQAWPGMFRSGMASMESTSRPGSASLVGHPIHWEQCAGWL